MVTNKHVTCHEHLLLIFGEYHQLLMGNPTIYSYEQIWLEVKPAMAISHAIWFVYGHPFHNQNPNTWVYMKIDMCIYIYILWVYKSLLTLLMDLGVEPTKMRLYKNEALLAFKGICDWKNTWDM